MPTQQIGNVIVNVQLNSQQFITQINNLNQQTQRSMRQMQSHVGSLDRAFLMLRRTFLSFFALSTATRAVRDIASYADAWKLASNQIAAANSIATIQARSMESLNQLAAESRTSLGDMAELYARLLRSTEGLAKSEEEVAKVTSIVTQAFKAGGASMQEAANGARQLGQSLASGIFQGDELRSIRENAPLLAQAIATEFNTTIGGLKKLGAEGKLTADRVFKAILENSKPIEDAFKSTNATIADSFTVLNNSITEYLGELDQATGTSKAFTKSILDLAQALRDASKAPQGTNAYANAQKDLNILWTAAKQKAADLNAKVKELTGVQSDFTEDTKDQIITLAQWANPVTAQLKLLELARIAYEKLTGQVETFNATQGRTGVGGVNMPFPETGGGRGFTGPGVGGFSPSKDDLDAIMKWREGAKGAAGDMERLVAAAKSGQEAFDQMNDRIEAENFLISKGMPLHDALTQHYIDEYMAAKKAQRGIDDLINSAEEYKDLQTELFQTRLLQEALGMSVNAFNELKIHIDALNMAIKAGVNINTEFGRGWVVLAEDVIRAKQSLDEMEERVSEISRTINSTVTSAISAVSSAFADAVVEGENFRDMLDALLKDLAKLAINSVMNLFLRQIIGSVAAPGQAGTGLLGGIAMPGTAMHGGGIVGSEGKHRMIPSGLIATAPRFHDGMMSNEFAAVLKKGEGVFTPDQMDALGGKTVNNFTVINQAPDTRVTEDRRENATGGMDVVATIRQVMTKEVSDPASSVHKSMKSTFGLSQAQTRR